MGARKHLLCSSACSGPSRTVLSCQPAGSSPICRLFRKARPRSNATGLLTSVRSSEMMLNCLRSSCHACQRRGSIFSKEGRTSSNSAFRCRKRSRWLVTMGSIEVSADDANGIGVVRARVS